MPRPLSKQPKCEASGSKPSSLTSASSKPEAACNACSQTWWQLLSARQESSSYSRAEQRSGVAALFSSLCGCAPPEVSWFFGTVARRARWRAALFAERPASEFPGVACDLGYIYLGRFEAILHDSLSFAKELLSPAAFGTSLGKTVQLQSSRITKQFLTVLSSIEVFRRGKRGS